jgi:uncharacterized protein YecE (DUF72 family)
MAAVRIGISGWRYPPWRTVFYPEGLPQRHELEFAARHFATIEINGSFYSLQRPEYYAAWYAQTPPGFVFAVKGSRFITHMKKLRDVQPALSNFLASGVLALRDKLGPMLWQFPESMRHDVERFDAFFRLLPRDTVAAAALARRHGALLRGRSCVASDARRPIRHAVELRNPASLTVELFALLRRHGIAWVIADSAGRFPYAEDITSDFVYIRLHGDEELYKSGYSQAAIRRWAARIERWQGGEEPRDAVRVGPRARSRTARGRDVYVYFDNDVKVHAPFDALALHRALRLPPWQTRRLRRRAPSLPRARPPRRRYARRRGRRRGSSPTTSSTGTEDRRSTARAPA